PLALIYMAITTFSGEADNLSLSLLAFFGVLSTVVGHVLYPSIYQGFPKKRKLPTLDWYSIFGPIAFGSLYLYTGEAIWTKLLPGVLISVYLITQRNRVPYLSKWIAFTGCLY